MTEFEKRKVTQLCAKGWGYRRISKELGISQNTVKSFCRRHPTNRDEALGLDGLCRNCLKPLKQTPHKKKKVFCSDLCRMKWWNAHTERVARKAYYTVVCQECGKKFESYGNAKRRFCSRACYANSRKKRAE